MLDTLNPIKLKHDDSCFKREKVTFCWHFSEGTSADIICQDLLVPTLLREGTTFAASSLEMVPGTPIPPMLARYVHVWCCFQYNFFVWLVTYFRLYWWFRYFFFRITNGITQALKLFHGRAFTCEYKWVCCSLRDSFFGNLLSWLYGGRFAIY